MNLINRVLRSRYEILEKIGEGGMAIVYKAKDKLLNRLVAVKVLKEEYASDENFVERFRKEAQSAAALTHPNIVSVYDVGTEDDNINYIVMELLETQTLKDYIEKNGALSSELTLKIAAQIASALDAAHKAHIIHRDIKPQNIALNNNMVAKVTDFGIAKITTTTSATITTLGSTVGSVHYFSPEHAKGGYTDEKSDLYSLGIVMYEMATGKIPFDADTPISVALMQIQDEPVEPIKVNPEVSPALNNIILKAMQKSTVTRYQSANELLIDISEALSKPDALISIPKSSVEAGETQVIPIISDADLEDDSLNLRTRQARKMSVTTRDSLANNKRNIKPVDEVKEEEKKEEIVEEKKPKKKSKKAVVIVVIFLILLSGVGFFGFKLWRKIHTPTEIEFTVPDLSNKKFEDVKNEYLAQNIEIVDDKYEYNSDIEEGYIISQVQEAGSVIKTGKIYVVVSKGPKKVTMTDVEGKDIKVARYELEDTLGLKVEVEEVVSEKVSEGIVISQEVASGEEINQGSTVKLTVSKGDGKAVVLMPTVIGKTESEAKTELEELKLTVDVTYEEDSTKANGTVISQSYPKNQSLKEGDLVKITVNKLLITKNVTLDLVELQGGTPLEEGETFKISVSGSIDGGPTNTYFPEKEYTSEDKTASFSINGYKNAVLKVYFNGNLAKEITVTF